jgi:exodeoxyribonuclease V alpha subunit
MQDRAMFRNDPLDDVDEISGTVERVTFRNEENGWSVIRFNLEPSGNTTVTGSFTSVNPGEHLTITGKWTDHQKFGRQFEMSNYRISAPATLSGMEKYLSSGLIPGIGPAFARKIIKHFGNEIFEVLNENPERVGEVPGIGKKKAASFKTAFESQKAIQNLMMWLQDHGVSPNLAIRIYREYDDNAIRVLKENPYTLADDLFGVGFIKADQIAKKLGMEEADPRRHQAGIQYILKEGANDGHMYIPRENLLTSAEELLNSDFNSINEALLALIKKEKVVLDDDRIYLWWMYEYETGIAEILSSMGQRKSKKYDKGEIQNLIAKIQRVENMSLAEEQLNAVEQAVINQCMVITGGPGTGKSTTVKVIVRAFERMGKNVRLASPTGRAAKRLEEASGRPASTIHRLLEYHPKNGFQRDADTPLDCRVVIVDEASMIDAPLMYHLLRALPPGCRLILVGDVDQLPSVGPGLILKDIINSEIVVVSRLTEIFRQAAGSLIVTNAHRINSGGKPQWSWDEGKKDMSWIRIQRESDDEERSLVASRIADKVINSIAGQLSKKFDPLTEIQVLTPMHAGPAGAKELNRRLQESCNPKSPDKAELLVGDRIFRLGDRVMQIRNNYELDVFNGDIGSIVRIDTREGMVTVQFDRDVAYKRSDLDELLHAYAITVHKSQGSEYPCVVIPITTSHWIMLQRNLIYTAMTRAKQYCLFVGQSEALFRAIKNTETGVRHTYLRERLALGMNS